MSESVKISMALCCIWAWLIPHFYIEFMEFKTALEKHSREVQSTEANSITEEATDEHHRTEHEETQHENTISSNNTDDDNSSHNNINLSDPANKALLTGAATAVLILMIVYTASAIGIALPTRNMDRRADAIVVGLGRILSAFLFAVFSIEIPKWMGVTYSSQRGNYDKQQISSTRELTFRVCWGIMGHFFVMYCIMLLYFTSPGKWTIPLSTGIGVLFGFGVVWAVWIGRTRYKKHTTLIAFIFSLGIMISSAAAFSAGCYYIKQVWFEDYTGYQEEYTLITFFGWLGINMIANYLFHRLTRRKIRQHHDGNSTTCGPSLTLARNDDAKSTWRYQSHIFEPPDSVCFAATELSKATAQVAVGAMRSPFKKAGSTFSRMRSSSFGSSIRASPRQSGDDQDNGPSNRPRSFSLDDGDDRIGPPTRTRTNTEPTVTGTTGSVISSSDVNNRARSYSDATYSSQDLNADDFASLHNHPASNLSARSSPASVSGEQRQYHYEGHALDTIKTGVSMQSDDYVRGRDLARTFADAQHGDELEPAIPASLSDLEVLRMRPSMDIEDVIPEEDDEGINDELKEPSLWFMIRTNTCCWKHRYYKAPRRKAWGSVLFVLKWVLWGITSLSHLLFLIICIGATMQQKTVRKALPSTFALLYPPDYVKSAMCAWDKASPTGDIRTFESPDAVAEANYTVIHCGACGACSNWNDLRLQWTTRSNLAQLGQTCVQKKFFGGGTEAVQDCNEELIGFTEECSECWTVDQMCASTQCLFIYLQSLVVNQVSNFNVDPNDITTTTCDEALCGPEFVPCSGATRRRMNIVSDIPRPKDQQCTVANENWPVIFDHP